jgi:hypothetical protein
MQSAATAQRRRHRGVPGSSGRALGDRFAARKLVLHPEKTKINLSLTPATGDSVLGLDFNWPACVAEVAPHFVAHSSTNFVRQACQCLAR